MTDRKNPGAKANQGFGAPGSPSEQVSGTDTDAPASKEDAMKTPADDGMDPQKLEKTIKSDEEIVPEEQLDEDISDTGAPPRRGGPVNAPE